MVWKGYQTTDCPKTEPARKVDSSGWLSHHIRFGGTQRKGAKNDCWANQLYGFLCFLVDVWCVMSWFIVLTWIVSCILTNLLPIPPTNKPICNLCSTHFEKCFEHCWTCRRINFMHMRVLFRIRRNLSIGMSRNGERKFRLIELFYTVYLKWIWVFLALRGLNITIEVSFMSC